jgi:hypothetical protein
MVVAYKCPHCQVVSKARQWNRLNHKIYGRCASNGFTYVRDYMIHDNCKYSKKLNYQLFRYKCPKCKIWVGGECDKIEKVEVR